MWVRLPPLRPLGGKMIHGHVGERLKQRFGIENITLKHLTYKTLAEGAKLFVDREKDSTIYITKVDDKVIYPVVCNKLGIIKTVLWGSYVDAIIRGQYGYNKKKIKKINKTMRDFLDE